MQTIPAPSMANNPEPPLPTMPSCFYIAKYGLLVATILSVGLTMLSLLVAFESKLPQKVLVSVGILTFVRFFACTVASGYAMHDESRKLLIFVAVVSILQYPISLFYHLKYGFAFDQLTGGAFVLMAIFSLFFWNRINKFCKLNPDIPPGPIYIRIKIRRKW